MMRTASQTSAWPRPTPAVTAMVSMAISAASVMKTRSMRRSDFFSLLRSLPMAFAG